MHSSSESGEPNLTPILDMVFQLITFFMLVINFQAAAVDMSLKLPVVGSARPVDKAAEELLVLNVTTKGDLIVYGQPKDAEQYLPKGGPDGSPEAEGQRRQGEAGGRAADHDRHPRADQKAPFDLVNKVLTECQKNGFRKFALRAMNAPTGAKS